MTDRLRSTLGVLGWLAMLGGAIVALHAAGSGGLASPSMGALSEWLAARDAATAAFALLRLLVLAAAYYLLVATVVALALRLARLPTAVVAAIEATTPTFVRRLIRGTAGFVLAVSVGGAGTAMAESGSSDDAPVLMRRLPDADVATTPVSEEPVTMRLLPPSDEAPPTPDAWTIEPGQHLWSVAETVLTRAWAMAPTDRQIDPYWRQLVERNRSRLPDPQSPDLLFPGQVLEVPAPPAEPRPGRV